MRRLKISGYSLLAAAALVAVVAFFYVVFDQMCETTVYARSPSPGGWLAARVQMTDCGASTGFSRVIYVQPSALPESDMIACRAVALMGEPEVRLNWSAAGGLGVAWEGETEVVAVAETCFGAAVSAAPK